MFLCCCHFGYYFSEFSPTGFYYPLSLIRVCESLQSFSVFGFSICCRPALVFSIMATSPNDETNPMSNRYIPRAARAVPHEEVVHTIEFRKITYTHYRIAPRNYGSWKPITEDTKVGELSNAFWMILSSHHWGPLRNMLWPAVRTSKHLPSNGGPIMMYQTLFLKEALLKLKNSAATFIMFYLNKLTQIPRSKALIPLFPTTNHYFGLVGVDPPSDVLKETQL